MSMGDHDTRTDALGTTPGIYRSDCADQERFTLTVGDTFPKCPSCRKTVGWNLAVATEDSAEAGDEGEALTQVEGEVEVRGRPGQR
jgi:hypothetical protein